MTTNTDKITYGPVNPDGSIPVYWGGKCRGKIMPGIDRYKATKSSK